MKQASFVLGALALAALSASPIPSPLAETDPPCRGGTCEVDDGYIGVYYTLPQTTSLAYTYPPGVDPDTPSSWFEYVAIINCPGNSPEFPRRDICMEL